MSTPEPEPDAYEQPLKRVKMRAGYDGDASAVAVAGRTAGAPVKGKMLVMGIQNYDGKRRLDNTLNDANAVARIFSDIGFDTHKLTDETAAGGKVSYNEMQRAISDFVKEIDENTVAAFAFMGESSCVCSFEAHPLILSRFRQATEQSKRGDTTSSRRSSPIRRTCRSSPSISSAPSRRSRPRSRSSPSPSSTAAARAQKFVRATEAAKA